MSRMKKCVNELGMRLKKRGIEKHQVMAQNMCSMWADENGIEKEFGFLQHGVGNFEETRKTFALEFSIEDIEVVDTDIVEDITEFSVRAITSGPHEYTKDDKEHKVYIEPNLLKDNIELFRELPIYVNHQRTPEDLIGKAINPEIEELENGKTAIKMLAQITEPTERANEVIGKVKDGDITNVSIDWFSKDVDVMGDIYATNIRPVEVSFIENEKMEAVCGECTIDTKCNTHGEKQMEDKTKTSCCCASSSGKSCECKKHEVDNMSEETNITDSDKIVEREFASLKTQLVEMETAHTDLTTKYEEARKEIEGFHAKEQKRTADEAERRKKTLVKNIISKEVLIGGLKDDEKDTRFDSLFGWEEDKLVGFSEALEIVPIPDTEKSFGKGKATDAEEKAVETEVEVERLFAMKDGKIRLNKKVMKGD